KKKLYGLFAAVIIITALFGCANEKSALASSVKNEAVSLVNWYVTYAKAASLAALDTVETDEWSDTDVISKGNILVVGYAKYFGIKGDYDGFAEKLGNTLNDYFPDEAALNAGGVGVLATTANALRLIGKNAESFNGKNILAAASYENTNSFSNTAYAAMLEALNGKDAPSGATKSTDSIITAIIADQADDGSWGYEYEGYVADNDMTAMIISGLGKYAVRTGVQAAIDKAVTYLAGRLNAEGMLSGWSGVSSSASTAVLLSALSSAKIDFTKDERFLHDGKNLFALIVDSFKQADGGYIDGAEADAADTVSAQNVLKAFYDAHAYLTAK
ncbi:MAG: hypothetical protein LBS99_00005, partial [Clostridiales bacterium]|nr:hypothetical protein [Clostridiales bacterium]